MIETVADCSICIGCLSAGPTIACDETGRSLALLTGAAGIADLSINGQKASRRRRAAPSSRKEAVAACLFKTSLDASAFLVMPMGEIKLIDI